MTSPFDPLHRTPPAGPASSQQVENFLSQVRSNVSGPRDQRTASHVDDIWREAGPLFREWAKRATPEEQEEVIKRAQINFWSESGELPRAMLSHLVCTCPLPLLT